MSSAGTLWEEVVDDTETFDAKVDAHTKAEGRAWVTVTYAQSLDGCISAQPGSPLLLSGQESMKMTHHLRMLHAGILVGVSTVLADNPSLTVRLVDKREAGNPVPVVLDTHLRMPIDCKLVVNQQQPAPVVVCVQPEEDEEGAEEEMEAWQARKAALEGAGAQILELPRAHKDETHPSLHTLMEQLLSKHGIDSVMVEGGAKVLTSFMQAHNEQSLVDEVLVTVAPTFVGGYHAMQSLLPSDGQGSYPRLTGVRVARMGDDVLMAGTLHSGVSGKE